MLHFFHPAREEFQTLTREDPSAFAPPPAFGPFRVLHQIGVGALGPVFRTYEPTRDRLIAVKVFRLDITPEQAQALADELSRAAEASLFHPSIVEPIAAGVEGTVAYRAEEYVAAESLDIAMRHYAPASLDKVLPFITQLAGAIDFARAAGVGHGALHPRDIFVTPDEARAAGFGVVEALERAGLRAPVRRPYTAPERIDGDPWSTPADVFSLAAIAFELLTARRPAGSGDGIGPLAGADVAPHEKAIHAVLARAMEADPARRYATALAFASALGAASRGIVAAASADAAEHAESTETTEDTGPALITTAAAGAQVASVHEFAPYADGAGDREVVSGGEAQDDSGAAVPPAEARLVQPEGEEAVAESETFHDVDAERDEDEAYHALLEAERRERDALGAQQERTLFDPEADEAKGDRYGDAHDQDDLPLRADAAAARGVSGGRSARAESVAAVPMPSAARAPFESGTYSASDLAAAARRDDRAPAPESRAAESRDGVRMLPLALTLMAGLLVGFAAGYFVGDRQATVTSSAAVPGTPGAGQQADGREWSEQTVAPSASRSGAAGEPPAVAPPVPSESPEPADGSAGPAERQPTAATRGRIVVRSEPARAAVTVNGRWRGRTPLTLDDLPFGRYSVRVVQPGFEVAREQVTLSSRQAARTLSFTLEPTRAARAEARTPARSEPREPAASATTELTGVLFVDSRPRGAQVFVDGRLVGRTPLRLSDVQIGSHVVRLDLRGHRRWSTSASVAAARETRVTGSLDPIP